VGAARFLRITQIFENLTRHPSRRFALIRHAHLSNPHTTGDVCLRASSRRFVMSDLYAGDFIPKPTPPCPVCGGETLLAQMHKAVEKMTDVFRCKRCNVEYPVARKEGV
jgi:hypothetical protein